jgi:murein DD-endopeptidase MepM/ murein hydrolase activator NlpD
VVNHNDYAGNCYGNASGCGGGGNSWGTLVEVLSPDGYLWLYAHGRPGSRQVSRGDTVQAGEPLMLMGNTGYSSGQHLHFEIFVGGQQLSSGACGARVIPQRLLPAIHSGDAINLGSMPIGYGRSHCVHLGEPH